MKPKEVGEGYEIYDAPPENALSEESGIILRDLYRTECPWFDTISKIRKGTVVYRYTGPTYDCVGPEGVPIILEKDTYPFIEVPRDSVIFGV